MAVVVLDEGGEEGTGAGGAGARGCGAGTSGIGTSGSSGGGSEGVGALELDQGPVAAALVSQPAEGLQVAQI